MAGAYYQMFYDGSASYMSNGPYIPTAKLKNSFTANDSRLNYTLNAKRFTKYVTNGDIGNNNTSYNNHRILRYADVLLLKAEAVLQSGGSPAAAISLINKVRTRAHVINLNASETNTSVIMQWIMDERLRELAGEGHRWFDLRRWHLAGYIHSRTIFSVLKFLLVWASMRIIYIFRYQTGRPQGIRILSKTRGTKYGS